MANWEILDGSDLDEFLNDRQEVKNCKCVEVHLDDGCPVSLVIELKDGSLVSFSSKETGQDGSRKELFVSTTKENDNV